MVTDEHIENLCTQLHYTGSAVIDYGDTKLAFIASSILSYASAPPPPTILVAWEGKGAFFWRINEHVNTFSLIGAGFSLRVAPTLADILNRVGHYLERQGMDRSSGDMPLLEGPEGQAGTPKGSEEE